MLKWKKYLKSSGYPVSISIIYIILINIKYPKIGHDYSYFLSHLLDNSLFKLNSGIFAIQWWSPSFGGGVPAYPNPQDIQLSLFSYAFLLLDPWISINAIIFLTIVIGFISCKILLRSNFGLEELPSTMGATFFILQGFYLNHVAAGHLTFVAFPFIPLTITIILGKKTHYIKKYIYVSLIYAYLIYTGCFMMVIIFALSTLLTIFLYSALCETTFKNCLIALKTFCLGCLIAISISLSKLSAIYSFMRFFPREITKYSIDGPLNIIQSIFAFFVHLFYAPIATFIYNSPLSKPFEKIGLLILEHPKFADIQRLLKEAGSINDHILNIDYHLRFATKSNYFLWENDIGISPVLLILLIILSILAFKESKIKRLLLDRINFRFVMFISVFMIVSIFVYQYSLGFGVAYAFLKTLPISASLHVNSRNLASFILPISILGAYAFSLLKTYGNRYIRKMYSHASIIITIVIFIMYGYLVSVYWYSNLNIELIKEQNSYIRDNYDRHIVKKVINKKDYYVFDKQGSSLKPYEPIFGYELEYFDVKVQEDNIFRLQNEYYNLTNPVSLVFPKENNLEIFERFKTNELQKVEEFIRYKRFLFTFPLYQRIANWISGFTILLCIFLYFTNTIILNKNKIFRFASFIKKFQMFK